MTVRQANLIASILVTLLGVSFAAISITSYTMRGRGDPGPGAFPLVTAVLAAIGGIAYLVMTLRSEESESFFTRDRQQRLQLLYLTLSIFGYVFIMQYAGFTIATFLFTMVHLWVIARYNLILCLVLSLIVAVGTDYIFQTLLFVPLPTGSLWR